jgi:tetratricopeptide (TPR) repeat protein
VADPFWVPPDLAAFAKGSTPASTSDRHKAEALMDVLVSPQDRGGLGIQYANDRTRTINEAWLERKANCLTLTMMYAMLAKQMQISAGFAESLDAFNWSRVGDVVLREKHMVAIVLWNPPNVLIADFLARAKTSARYGSYFLDRMTDTRAKSLFYSNRAVESLVADNLGEAMANVQLALGVDSTNHQAWNVKGVIERSQKNNQEAEKSYKNAIRNNPNDVAAIGNLAALYRSEGFFEEATRLRVMEDRLRKADPYYLAFLASEAMEKGNLKKARRLIRKAIKINPSDSDFYLTLSNIYRAQNKNAEALVALRKARSHSAPDSAERLDAMIDIFEADAAG